MDAAETFPLDCQVSFASFILLTTYSHSTYAYVTYFNFPKVSWISFACSFPELKFETPNL
jgi:hypothetical protein